VSDFQRQINQRIEAFISEITELARRQAIDELTRATRVLGSSGGGRARGNGVRVRGGKRSSEQVEGDATRLLAFITESPGKRAEEIAREIGLSTKEMALPLKKLIGGRQIRTEGQKRATRYFPGGGRGKGRRKRGR
jgi:hypothetical protein